MKGLDKSLIILALETLREQVEDDVTNRRIRNSRIDRIDKEIKEIKSYE